jgi:hypothetical protein
MIIVNEFGKIIDITKIESEEQDLVRQYIHHDDIVFELGARYGSVSCTINLILKNKKNQVSVEPDKRVWDALEKNKMENGCEFIIVKGFVSTKTLDLTNHDNANGYGTTTVINSISNIPSYPFSSFNLPFNVLVADCEGFLEIFLDENPSLYSQLRLVIFEADYPDKCNYTKIKKELIKNGFTKMREGHQNVFLKKS